MSSYAPQHRAATHKLRNLLTVFAVAITALVTGLVTTGGGATAQAGQTKIVTVQLDDRPDSGEDGNTWAYDDITRQFRITETSTPGHYEVTVIDNGQFTAIVDEQTPGLDGAAVFETAVSGKMNGGFTATVDASPNFATLDRTLQDTDLVGGTTTSGQMIAKLFTDGHNAQPFLTWGWTYEENPGSEVWVNADDGNSGNITG